MPLFFAQDGELFGDPDRFQYMTQESRSIELNIVDASSVRRYARSEFLPRPMRQAVEETLLDDERARDLVRRTANSPANRISGRMKRFLLRAGEACRNAARAYSFIGERPDIAPSMLAFAENRVASREFILSRIDNLLQNCNEALAISAVRHTRAPEKPALLEAALQYAADCDEAFIAKLKRAFAAPSCPPFKASIAGWIAHTERDIGKFYWISPMRGCSSVPSGRR